MSSLKSSTAVSQEKTRKTWLLISIFMAITIIGLAYVKWWPYYGKALLAADQHSIGTSILKGIGADQTMSLWQSAFQFTITYFKAVWKAALLGMIVATLIQALLPVNWLHSLLGRSSLKSTLIGGVSSLPTMMCSCCAAPIAVGMHKQQVSIGASLAFWLGNPLLNPATLVFMSFVLSWKFTVLRVVFGLLVTFGISFVANRFAKTSKVNDLVSSQLSPPSNEHQSLWVRWLNSFGKMLLQVVPAYVISVFILGALQNYMFPMWINVGIIAIILFAIIGTLFVIPTAAEIPIIQSFLSIGVNAGPAAALLITLPAISLPSLLLVSRAFPPKVLTFVTLSVIILGVLCGFVGELWL
ncbi:permease [Paenibacillus sp. PL91]|uniref:permease n=1 Tax=Paenibacillus sp. PL91 TaxID=2729538 RepID=UPI00145D1E53|nr:permease [Paenibacillus sp. PL91]MBC9200110.1 permease [Paenibacillus sp. PL91]